MNTGIHSILHLRASNFVGGPERQILAYCQPGAAPWPSLLASFVPHGGETPAGEGHALLAAARAAGIPAFALPGGGLHDLQAAATLGHLLEEQQVGLICTHGYRADLLAFWAARRRGIPVASFLRGWTGENARVRLYEACDRALLGRATRIVCLAQTQTATLPARLQPRSRVVVNAVAPRTGDPATARAALAQRFGWAGARTAPLVVGIAGRLSPEKGASVFLQAAATLQRPGLRFLIFGDGALRAQLENQAQRLGLSASLHFAGHCTDWLDLLPGLDLLVNPSFREQAPNVVLEAMAAGIAVVATAVGAVAEIAGTPPALALVPAGQPHALAQAIDDLLQHPQRRAALADAGRERSRTAYSPTCQRQQLEQLFAELLPAAEAIPAGTVPLPQVSLVLPVRHEAANLAPLLQQLLEQDYPPERYEILIADGGAAEADDGTTALAQDYARRFPGRVRWLANPGRRSSAGRNCGLAAARGEWIVFVDGHCRLPGPAWLRQSMAAAAARGALCLSRPQPLDAEYTGFWQAAIAHARASRIGHGADSTIFDPQAQGWVDPSSSGAAYHRRLLQLVGAYDECFDACEDVEFNHRLAQTGVRAWLAPEAVVYYAARRNLGGLWRQMLRYGRGRVRLSRKHHDAFSLSQCLPALWLLWLPLAAVGVSTGPARALWAATLLLYAAAVAASALGVGRRHGWRQGLAAPLIFVTIHAGLGAGAWRELLFPAAAFPAASVPKSESLSRSNS